MGTFTEKFMETEKQKFKRLLRRSSEHIHQASLIIQNLTPETADLVESVSNVNRNIFISETMLKIVNGAPTNGDSPEAYVELKTCHGDTVYLCEYCNRTGVSKVILHELYCPKSAA